MDKKDILSRNKEGKPNDEYESYVTSKAIGFGLVGMAMIFLILIFVNVFYLQERDNYDLFTLTCGFSAVASWYRCKEIKSKRNILFAILTTIFTVAFFTLHCMGR